MLYRADVRTERGFSESCFPFLSQSLPVWIQSCDRNTETIFSEWVAYTFLESRKITDTIPVCLSLGHGVFIVPLILSSHCQHALQKGSRNCHSLTSRGDRLTEQAPLSLNPKKIQKKKYIKWKLYLKSRCWNEWQFKVHCH